MKNKLINMEFILYNAMIHLYLDWTRIILWWPFFIDFGSMYFCTSAEWNSNAILMMQKKSVGPYLWSGGIGVICKFFLSVLTILNKWKWSCLPAGFPKPWGLITSPPSTDRGMWCMIIGLDTRSKTGAAQDIETWKSN